jgi:hypothetical protein
MKSKIDFPEDCGRICQTAYQSGYFVKPTEAQQIWRKHSETSGVPWLRLPKTDDELWEILSTFFNLD